MQITISKETAKAAMVSILVFANSIQQEKEDGSLDEKKLNATLKSIGLTPKDFERLAKLVDKLDRELNNNSKKKQ